MNRTRKQAWSTARVPQARSGRGQCAGSRGTRLPWAVPQSSTTGFPWVSSTWAFSTDVYAVQRGSSVSSWWTSARPLGGTVRQECEELHVEQVTPTAPRFPDALGRTVRRLRGIVGTAQGAAGMERIECVDRCRGAARTRRKRQCGLPQAEDPVFAEG